MPENHESMTIQVHKIAANYDQLPERFIHKEDEEFSNIVESSAAGIPVIDVNLLASSKLEIDRLKSAISTWGCFQAINHGIEGSLLEKVREVSQVFFNLSTDEKKKCLREENDIEGYRNDMVLSDHQTLDWTDRLFLTVLPKDQQRLQFWPQNLTNIMSNGIFKSPMHRALVNSKNERITVAMFCMPQTEKDIGPVDWLITADTPRLYKNVTFNLDFYLKNYQQGTRSIDACKI
ncbi:thebaine 6-O-demethylase-like [Bidens hawaiensis]|uniref:thebaine 6-O-demethylase-like n=1 Tax=Bidens hawaiensis TaxID=980011 RepID=UPI00404ADF8F